VVSEVSFFNMAPKGSKMASQKGVSTKTTKVVKKSFTKDDLDKFSSGSSSSGSRGPEVISDAIVELAGPLKRSLTRRDTDEAVDRVFTGKLGHIPSDRLEGMGDGDDGTLRSYLSSKIREFRKTKKKFNASFWAEVYQTFPGLGQKLNLPAPPSDGSVREELLEVLGYVLSENPSQRKSEPFVNFLLHCEPLNYTELYGAIRSVQEGPLVLRSSSIKCMHAILIYGCRTRH
jgi:hypothetical protein